MWRQNTRTGNSVAMICVQLSTTQASAVFYNGTRKMLCRQKRPKMSTYGLDVGNVGKKPHQRKRGKKSKRAESFVTEHVDRLQSTADVQQPVKLTIIRRNGQHEVSGGSVNPFSLVFLSDHTCVTTCTGCSRRFALMADGGLSLLLHMTLLLLTASVVPGKTKQEF